MPEDYDSFDPQQRRNFWQTHIERWQASGLSQRAYCVQHDLILHRFYDWRRRIKSGGNNRVSFLPVSLTGSASFNKPSVRIHTPNGYTIEIGSQLSCTEVDRLIAMVASL
ncbi:IS66 family insertion sequence element accessory protein TnpA [Desulfosarcina ovata]|uniref:Transposase n=1 Tax=Desulfosarcina ovata subsp. ovata TaxID=2752305 RepID=A0A5K8A7T6_9BACT|nr:IS66 family insertion sequence element accessory protein TnpB [Desulfosarcina ovata]BBO88526.1 hypothetical protein DSCOOX_17060 [Desulfosarcina ovata subsp. ovata]